MKIINKIGKVAVKSIKWCLIASLIALGLKTLYAKEQRKEYVLKNDIKAIFEKQISKLRGEATKIHIYVENNPEVNAYATITDQGEYVVVIFQGIIDLAKNSDQVALVVGHEIAHHLLGHTEGHAGVKVDYFYGPFSGSRSHELASDTFGATLARAAGYNPCEGIDLWKRMGQGVRKDSSPMDSHPSALERARNFNEVFECKVADADLFKDQEFTVLGKANQSLDELLAKARLEVSIKLK